MAEHTVTLARVLLAVIFLVAGIAKLRDLPASRRTLRDFGLPWKAAAPLGFLLPVGELVVAALLLVGGTAGWGAMAATALLLGFTIAMLVNIALGRAPECRCFGQLQARRIDWRAVTRNAGLLALSFGVAWYWWGGPGTGMIDLLPPPTPATAAVLAGVVLLSAQAWLALQLLQQNGRLLLRVEALEAGLSLPAASDPVPPAHGLPIGSPAPQFSLPDRDDRLVSLDDLLGAKPVLLIFAEAGCAPCAALLPDLVRWQRRYADRWTTVLITRGKPADERNVAFTKGVERVLFQRDTEVSQEYGCPGTPGAVLIDTQARIAGPLAMGPDEIRSYVEEAGRGADRPRRGHAPVPLRVLPSGSQEQARPAALRIGQMAPAVRLPTLSGEPFDLAVFRGRKVVLLFFNPGCVYCQRMLPELQQYETVQATGGPHLVMVSSGNVEQNRALELQSVLLLDEGFTAGRAFGAGGTPSAILIDTKGRVASPLVAGATGVMELFEPQRPRAVAGTAGA
jgi:peroxiredoxin/uncharacterized membrane protein YphA (DoxX/SURF4 family)